MNKPNLLDMYEELDEVESDITKTLNTLSGFFRAFLVNVDIPECQHCSQY